MTALEGKVGQLDPWPFEDDVERFKSVFVGSEYSVNSDPYGGI